MAPPPQGNSLFLVAGEPSGDLMGALLARELKEIDPAARLYGMGGPKMQAEGVAIVRDLTQHAVVGFLEVLKHLPHFLKTLKALVQEVERLKPRAVILIDYPGFNLRLAHELKKRGIRVIYFISPQIWAWRRDRVKKIARRVDKMICLFEFEVPLYESQGLPVRCVGHPFLDIVRTPWTPAQARRELGLQEGIRTIGLLPGSRENEIRRHLPVLIQSAGLLVKRIGPCQFVISQSEGTDRDLFTRVLSEKDSSRFRLIQGHFLDLVNSCDFIVTASGSATLITGILEKPMIVIYRVGFLTALLARLFITIPHIGLVNVVAGKTIVPELLQQNATPQKLAGLAASILTDPSRLDEMKQSLRKVRELLGQPGAARRAAQEVLSSLC
ncbi:MAG: lipid-A-disaccharide synthase [Candidatus Omnitrophica bacterium]|nr:lipid-A-disaccharide synthase [Candidatus Omnitrophota bacterium]